MGRAGGTRVSPLALLRVQHLTVARPRENHFWLQPDGLVAAQGGRGCCVGQGDQVLARVSLGQRKTPKRNGERHLSACLHRSLANCIEP